MTTMVSIDEVTATDQSIATELKLENRIEQTARKEVFITIKDHKPNFLNNPTLRLINPTKPEIGKINKQTLEKANLPLRTATNATLYRNTIELINWFKKIENKHNYSFISFNIFDF